MALSNNEILNLTDSYINEYNLEKEKHFENLKQIFKNHGNKPFYVFRYISFVKNFLLLSKSGMYTIEVPSRNTSFWIDFKKHATFKLKKEEWLKNQ